ncbi:glycosyltransferase [Haloarcula nitratireducens]|uniref:Glycosyltransferase n=1 Tax=Haloarcula nitratireducens TaxID=2487749 RepID=A0AAW4P814_9EURY|nr:glycosyltransferase [Halomicroarcula nitratireducens]MBX0293815.1 glycosyltransferase [Halomicroarcula nitratireducens]
MAPDGAVPTVSVIVPVYDDPEGVDRTLRALTEQTVSTPYEVLVVDNGSTDRTPAVVASYCREHPDLVELLVEDEIQGSYAARNAGIERAGGEVLAFVDADVQVEPTWVDDVAAAMQSAAYVGFDVQIEGRPEDGPVVAFNHVSEFPVERYIEEEQFAPTCCLAVRREVVEAVGPFDERFRSSGDVEFGRRVHDAGFEQAFDPSVTMYHPPRSAVALLKKYVRVGRGLGQRRRFYPERFDRHPLFTPANYLPTISPRKLRSSAREVQGRAETTFPLYTLCVFYVLEQLQKVCMGVGRLADSVMADDTR